MSDAGQTYNDTTPISNNNATCGSGGAWDEDFYGGLYDQRNTFTFGEGLSSPIPAGYWRFHVKSVLEARFSMLASEPRGMYDKPAGLVPVIAVHTDPADPTGATDPNDGKILSIEVEWFWSDGTSGTWPPAATYQPMTDVKALHHLVTNVLVVLENMEQAPGQAPRRETLRPFDPSQTAQVTPDQVWYYGSLGAAGERAQRITLFYTSAGIGYWFEFVQ